MSLVSLALKNIAGSTFRSVVVLLCAFVVSGFALATTMIVRGAEDSLRLGQERLGADLIVIPTGTEPQAESALLMGKPTNLWMPEANVAQIASIRGVGTASPQLFLASMKDSPCCSASEMFMIAIDPRTDFTIKPWLELRLGRDLGLGESLGGSLVFVPPGEKAIKLYGYEVSLAGNLESTGTGLDQTLFLNFETAREMVRVSQTSGMAPLDLPPDSVSAVLVKVAPGWTAPAVAAEILHVVSGVDAVPSPDLYQTFRKQFASLLRGVVAMLSLTWALSMIFIALVFSMAVNERRREIGVLRALGASRVAVLWSILLEAGILALGGGVVGSALFGLATYLFHNLLVAQLGVPFLLPSIRGFYALVGAGLGLALATVVLAALVPALRVSFQEPALAMRE